MVTFDKGGRVARLGEGVWLDARQTGILFAQLASSGRTARLVDWDRTRDPSATRRIEDFLEQKGPADKQTLLLALSMSVLTAFEIDDANEGRRYLAEGTRSGGYTITRETEL